MVIIESLLTKNPCYTEGRKIKVKGLMLHSVGCNQPKASVFINKWNKETYDRACVHAFIDAENGIVYQTLPWDHRGWHCGKSGNNTHIGVEMCEPNTIKYLVGSTFIDTDPIKTKEAVMRTYNSAVELFAKLCMEYKLDPIKNICSHKEGNKLGIATNHGDPEHLWSKFGLTMDKFRLEVKNKINEIKATTLPYVARITTTELNIRSGPSADYKICGTVKKGDAYTIVEEQNNWGRLKSGVGWISLKYTERI